MTNQSSGQQIDEAEMAAFGHKLAAWSHDLPENERVILYALIARAADADDTSGYWENIGRPTGFFISPGGFGSLLRGFGSGGSSDSDSGRRDRP